MADAVVRAAKPVRSRSAEANARPRHLALPSIPAHVAVVVGIATGGYAISLAGVSALEASSEAAVARDRDPVGMAIAEAAVRHDELRGRLDAAARWYEGIADDYGTAGNRMSGVDEAMRRLAGAVDALDGQTRALPTRLAMPPVVRSVPRSSGSTSHATSGGSAP